MPKHKTIVPLLLLLLLSIMAGCRTRRNSQTTQTLHSEQSIVRADSLQTEFSASECLSATDDIEVSTTHQEFDIAPSGEIYLSRQTTITARRGRQTQQTTVVAEQTSAITTASADSTLTMDVAHTASLDRRADGATAFSSGAALALLAVMAIVVVIWRFS